MINKKGLAVGQVFILLIASVAFVYMVAGVNSVSGVPAASTMPVSTKSSDYTPKEGDFFKINYEGEEVIARWEGTSKGVASGTLKDGTKVTWDAVYGSEALQKLIPSDEELIASGWKNAPSSKSQQYAFGEKYPIPLTKYGEAGHLIEGLVWASAFAGFVKVIGGFVAEGKEGMVSAIAKAGFFGVVAYKGMQQVFAEGGWAYNKDATGLRKALQSQWTHVVVGALVAWAVYVSQYEEESFNPEQVTFQCMPWQAPHGGENCELCNDDARPCSEYRCKSLGQSCVIINSGTASERCVNQNPRDTNPPVISPWEEKLTPGYAYTDVKLSPPGPGFKIKRTEGTNVCVKAFTPIEFGILTDEPAQCKIDIEYQDTFESMATYFGGDNIYKYNHSEFLTLPRAKDIKNSSISLEMGNEMTLYVRCRDSQGNMNQAAYAVRFCVDSAPDATPPQIKATSIESGSCVAADRNSTEVSFYTDEPAQCKWGFDDQAYDSLPYNMSCTTQVYQVNSLMLYTCNTNLNSVSRAGTNYYVRCEDNQNEPKENRNAMQQSEVFKIFGSNPLKLKTVLPNGTIYGGVSPMRVDLRAETLFGCDNNKAVCFYSSTGQASSYVAFFDTDKSDGVHTQRLDLYAGTHTYFVKCVDAGGNVAESNTTFTLDIDTTSPIITRAYYQEEYLKVVTARNSDCVYSTESCDYLFEEGKIMPYAKSTTHVITWEEDKTFYIKCRDEFINEPIDCSMIVRPKENFLFY